jgi:hypothetical protein
LAFRPGHDSIRPEALTMDAYIYSYLVGGVIFLIGMYYAVKHDYVGFSGKKLRNLLISLGVLMFFAILQGYLQYAPMSAAPAKAYTGGAEAVLEDVGHVRGTPLDYAIVVLYFGLILFYGI